MVVVVNRYTMQSRYYCNLRANQFFIEIIKKTVFIENMHKKNSDFLSKQLNKNC